ncbi:MAG: TMEM43 family protein [bacterium]|nr:TMEM43 family protein [bacterium]
MPNSFTKVTRTSYGGRIKNSIVGVIIGLLLFAISFVVLWKNEEDGARLAKQENYISKNAIEVDSKLPSRENDEKLIATSGKLITGETLSDENLMVRNSLVLKRDVEMYQWDEDKKTETHDELGGGETTTTTYTYTKRWSSRHIDSSRFNQQAGHLNPDFPITSLRLNAQNATLGGYIANELQTSSVNELTTITNLPQNNLYEFIDGKYYTKGASPSSPNVGDIRISYLYAPSGANVSIIGQQNSDNTISKHSTKYGNIYWQEDGIADKATMLKNIKASNSLLTNILRVVGWFLMFIGLLLISGPISAILKFIPALGSITGFLAGIVALLVSLVLSIITIGIAWFAYRPLSAIGLFIVAGALVYLIKGIIDKRKTQMPADYPIEQ